MLPRLFHTANFKLALLYALIFSLSVSVLGAILFYDVQHSLEQQMQNRIQSEMEQLLGDYRDDGMEELRHDIRERIEANPGNRLSYHIQNAEGRVIFDRITNMPTTNGWHMADNRVVLVERLDGDYLLAISGALTGIKETKAIILHGLAITFLLTLILGASGGVWVSHRFLRRIDHVNRTAEAIGNGDLSQRLQVRGTQDDFDQLAVTINNMLDRIEKLLTEVRMVSTNIAHDMRTPLAKLRNDLELLTVKVPDNVTEIESSIALLDEALGTFSALLRIAEVESGSRRQAFEAVDLSALLKNLYETYAVVAEHEGKSLVADIDDNQIVYGDRHLLTQMFANVIENGLKHGGQAVAVRIALAMRNKRVEATISDSGVGIPNDEQAHILKPFYRMDRSRTTRGNGLGLSLVAAIASLHEATLGFENKNPGFDVVLSFKPHQV